MFFDLGADKLTLLYRGVDQASNQGKSSFKKGENFPLGGAFRFWVDFQLEHL